MRLSVLVLSVLASLLGSALGVSCDGSWLLAAIRGGLVVTGWCLAGSLRRLAKTYGDSQRLVVGSASINAVTASHLVDLRNCVIRDPPVQSIVIDLALLRFLYTVTLDTILFSIVLLRNKVHFVHLCTPLV